MMLTSSNPASTRLTHLHHSRQNAGRDNDGGEGFLDPNLMAQIIASSLSPDTCSYCISIPGPLDSSKPTSSISLLS